MSRRPTREPKDYGPDGFAAYIDAKVEARHQEILRLRREDRKANKAAQTVELRELLTLEQRRQRRNEMARARRIAKKQAEQSVAVK